MFEQPPGSLSSDSKPIVVKKRRLACENRIWKVFFDNIVEEGGAEVADYLVVESHGTEKMPGKVTGVTILPFIEGRVGLIRFYRHAIGETVWEAPRGFIDVGEEPVAAASRELEEETGLLCPPERLRPFGYMCPEAGTIAGKSALFAAIDCEYGGQALNEEMGLGQLRFFPFAEVRRMVDAFEIEDAYTLALLYRYINGGL